MTDLNPDAFDAFFYALHGAEPFPWQRRLAERILSGRGWPDAISVPTGAGKTACIDIALFALAADAANATSARRAPRRLFFVVDRRIIVDEAYDHARRIAANLDQADSGILAEVAQRLRSYGGRRPLDCVALRGGVYRDDHWVRDPLQPTVLASTVDQIGSRLLYRGYGLRSDKLTPIHTGLVANDALVILDEAHCANPFRQTLQAIMRYRTWRDDDSGALDTPFAHTLLSATPPMSAKDRFGIDQQDRDHPLLGQRIHAAKPTVLKCVDRAKGGKALEQLARAAVDEATAFITDFRSGAENAAQLTPAIGIIVNRVETARRIHATLRQAPSARKGTAPAIDCLLLTGRMRPVDRDTLIGDWLKKLGVRNDNSPRPLDRPVVVVATQTLEVGANLDFDALITECASLDALRQRFGRLDRGGRATATRATILARADQIAVDNNGDAKAPDPVYGHALARTWHWLTDQQQDAIDFGIDAFARLLPDDTDTLLESLAAPSPDAAALLPSHLDLLVQTSPRPAPDPDVSVFLHGPQRNSPDVLVCWRADLTETDPTPDPAGGHPWIDTIALCPPVAAEFMPVPLRLMQAWLRGEDIAEWLTDVDNPAAADGQPQGDEVAIHFLRWAGPEDPRTAYTPPIDQLRPGDTLILPETIGGWNQLGFIPDTAGTGVDQAEAVRLAARRSGILRLHPALLSRWPTSPAAEFFIDLAHDRAPPEELDEVRERLLDLATSPGPDWRNKLGVALANDARLELIPHPHGGWVLRGGQASILGQFTDEDSSSSTTVTVELHDHLNGVGTWARHFAQRLGLPQTLRDDLQLAGRLHDLGKADPRFQALLHGGNPWLAAAGGRLLAKSGKLPSTRQAYQQARRSSGYPPGARHELLSVRLAQSAAGLLEQAHDPELVLHLVASHHGRCRPFAPVIHDDQPLQVEVQLDGQRCRTGTATGLERIDSGISERFWRTVRRYGWWGTAWLEALLRLADWRRSEQEQNPTAAPTTEAEQPTTDEEPA